MSDDVDTTKPTPEPAPLVPADTDTNMTPDDGVCLADVSNIDDGSVLKE